MGDLTPLIEAYRNARRYASNKDPQKHRGTVNKVIKSVIDTMSGGILSAAGPITQGFGAASKLYKSGFHRGVDVGVPTGTKVATPAGQWKVIEAYNKAMTQGVSPTSTENRGYGNSILLQNAQGEKIRYSHLRPGGVFVNPGDMIPGGGVVGETGATGKTAGRTGQHLDIEYYDQAGKLADIRKTPHFSQRDLEGMNYKESPSLVRGGVMSQRDWDRLEL